MALTLMTLTNLTSPSMPMNTVKGMGMGMGPMATAMA